MSMKPDSYHNEAATELEREPEQSLRRASSTISHSRRWYHWHEPGTSKEEKRLILKLDFFILVYTCTSFFVKCLEQTSITNAYVAGMRQNLDLEGNELNWLTTYYNVGVIIGGPIVTLGLTAVHPAYWLPGTTLCMSLFVLLMYKAQNIVTLYALRFCAGFLSSGIMPGSYYIIGSWYRRSEIARRSGVFTISSLIGSMISGYIEAGLYTSLNGHLGLASCRWLFIIVAVLGIPPALFGFFCCPNEPAAKRMWWMTAGEHILAIKRLETEDRGSYGKLSRGAFKRVAVSWQLYLFPIAYGMKELTCGTEMMRWMTLYLQRTGKYSVSQINAIPSTVACSEIVFIFLSSALADHFQEPALLIFTFGLLQIFGYAVLLVFPNNQAFMVSAYIIGGSGYSTIGPILNAWANSRCGGDKVLRVVTTALISATGYLCETLAQQFFYPVTEAPEFKPSGYAWGFSWAVVSLLLASIAIPVVERTVRCERPARREVGVDSQEV